MVSQTRLHACGIEICGYMQEFYNNMYSALCIQRHVQVACFVKAASDFISCVVP